MNLRKSLSLALMLACVAGMSAAVLTPEQALSRANLNDNGPRRAKALISPELALTVTDAAGEEPACYVFTPTKAADGFVILSADDIAMPVLAYSDNERFDAANIPPAMQWWLDRYARQIAAVRDIDATQQQPMAAKAQTRPQRDAISPMVTTKWNQGAPYNNLCPTFVSQGSTYRGVTGCMATAMAQVIKYFEYPTTHGFGTHSYTWNEQTLSFDYDNTTFDWANMLDNYDSSASTQANNAVATLMVACGISADMNYGIESGANLTNALRGLKENFGYNPNAHRASLADYEILEWEDLIYDQLQNVGPVLYTGFNYSTDGSSVAGHAFVCDGYSYDGYFHINWGWGGNANGFFLLTALNPDSQGIGGSNGGYSENEAVAVDLCPATGSEIVDEESYMLSFIDSDLSIGELHINETSVALGGYCSFDAQVYNTGGDITSNFVVGLQFVNEASDYSDFNAATYILGGDLDNPFPSSYYYNAIQYKVQVPADLPTEITWCDPSLSQATMTMAASLPATYTSSLRPWERLT